MEWRPIETAPMDGTIIDLWSQSGRQADCKWDTSWTFWGMGGFDTMDWVGIPEWEKPTHWMPLPDPPAA